MAPSLFSPEIYGAKLGQTIRHLMPPNATLPVNALASVSLEALVVRVLRIFSAATASQWACEN
jgi:hypothetical protein